MENSNNSGSQRTPVVVADFVDTALYQESSRAKKIASETQAATPFPVRTNTHSLDLRPEPEKENVQSLVEIRLAERRAAFLFGVGVGLTLAGGVILTKWIIGGAKESLLTKAMEATY